MKRYQLGYRLPHQWTQSSETQRWCQPYKDLPEFDSTQESAYALHSQLVADYLNAEWRLVEVVNSCVNCVEKSHA